MTRLILLTAVAIAASAQPAHDLARQARSVALEYSDLKKAQSLINAAITQWDQEPHDADYGRALDLSGMLAQHRKADLASVVEPLYRAALDTFDHAGSTASESDTALALELEALALKNLGRTLDGAPFNERALQIRAGIIRDAYGLPPSQSDGGTIFRLERDIKPPQVISKHEPAYNNLARLVKVQGTVILELVVNTDGGPQDFRLVRSVGFGLDEEAARVVKEWRFQPATRGENPVALRVSVEVNYKLR